MADILILGGGGFVGSGIARQCAARGHDYSVITRANYEQTRGSRCRIFINANGNSRKPLAKQDPVGEFDASVRSVRASLDDFQYDFYVHLSSCDVYPDCSAPEVTREDQPLDPASQSPYGFHKYLAEQCVRHAAPRHLILRLGGFVGPGLKKNAIFDILNGGPLWLDPESELQFMNTDACGGLVLDMAEKQTGTYNLCGRGVVRLRDVMEAAGSPDIRVNPGSPRVRYEVSVEKVSRVIDVPETRDAVFAFVRNCR
jgi:nucleoside-diphosphate-sugar epimerase